MTQDPPAVRFSRHAIQRYRDHVRDCGEDQAERELAQLLKDATVQPDPPDWVVRREQTADGWLWLTSDLACPLSARPSGPMVAVSVFARGALGETERRWRTERRAYDRQSKRQSKSKPAMRSPRPQRAPDAEEWS